MDQIPNAGPIASCANATPQPTRSTSATVSPMDAAVSANPSDVWSVSGVPTAVLNGDTITATVEVVSVREDKPITERTTTVARDDGVVAVEGTALCYTVAV